MAWRLPTALARGAAFLRLADFVFVATAFLRLVDVAFFATALPLARAGFFAAGLRLAAVAPDAAFDATFDAGFDEVFEADFAAPFLAAFSSDAFEVLARMATGRSSITAAAARIAEGAHISAIALPVRRLFTMGAGSSSARTCRPPCPCHVDHRTGMSHALPPSRDAFE